MAQNEGDRKINPVQVQKFLSGIDYPVEKRELVERARDNGAPDDVISLLESLPDRTYDAPTAVTREIADQ